MTKAEQARSLADRLAAKNGTVPTQESIPLVIEALRALADKLEGPQEDETAAFLKKLDDDAATYSGYYTTRVMAEKSAAFIRRLTGAQ